MVNKRHGYLEQCLVQYADILYGHQFNLTTYSGFGVDATPTVVIALTGTKKKKVLTGAKEITLPAVKAALAEIAK